MNRLFCILTIFAFMAGCVTFGQSDTIVDGIKFNYVTHNNNGQIYELGNYNTNGKNITRQGYWIIYDTDGHLVEKGFYHKDKKNGDWTEQGTDNFCCWMGRYKKGQKNGRWYNGVNLYHIYKRGKLISTQTVEVIE